MSVFSNLIEDTLKKDGRFSRTSLTMLSAWVTVLGMALVDFCDKGLRYEVWLALASIATGIKIVDSYAKNIQKEDK